MENKTPLMDLYHQKELSGRTFYILYRKFLHPFGGFEYLEELTHYTEDDLTSKLRLFKTKRLNEVKAALAKRGLSLK